LLRALVLVFSISRQRVFVDVCRDGLSEKKILFVSVRGHLGGRRIAKIIHESASQILFLWFL